MEETSAPVSGMRSLGLREMRAGDLRATNNACRPRHWAFSWFGRPARLRTVRHEPACARQDVVLAIHGAAGLVYHIGLSHTAIQAGFAAHVGDIPWGALPPGAAAVIVQDGLDALAAEAGNAGVGSCRVVPELLDPHVFAGRPGIVLEASTSASPHDGFRFVWLAPPRDDPRGAEDSAWWVSASDAGLSDAVPGGWLALPVTLRGELGWLDLPLNDIRQLRAQDVLVPDRWWASDAPGRLVLRAGNRPLFWAMQNETGNTMTVMQTDLPPETGPSDAELADAVASVADLPLRLTFDLGEHHLTLRELSAIGPGHTFPLGRGPTDAVVLRINGMRVGEGELVSIDGQLGVSITRMAPPGAP